MPTSLKILIPTWLIGTAFLDMTYECNLRAFLVKKDYQQPIDSAADILELGKKLYLPRGQTSLASMLASSSGIQINPRFQH